VAEKRAAKKQTEQRTAFKVLEQKAVEQAIHTKAVREMVAGQGMKIAVLNAAQANAKKEHRDEINWLQGDFFQRFRVAQQNATKDHEELKATITALEKKGAGTAPFCSSAPQALIHVFTWSADSSWSCKSSLPFTFTGGVRGCCHNTQTGGSLFMGSMLIEGPACTLQFSCSILDKDDNVLRNVAHPALNDNRKPPAATCRIGQATGTRLELTEADRAGAERADGSIKLRMVVHLYLPG
jgi:hypothetical protein